MEKIDKNRSDTTVGIADQLALAHDQEEEITIQFLLSSIRAQLTGGAGVVVENPRTVLLETVTTT